MTQRFYPNLALARRIAADIGCDDPVTVYRAIQQRCPGVLQIHVRQDELSRERYEDLCCAIESAIQPRLSISR